MRKSEINRAQQLNKWKEREEQKQNRRNTEIESLDFFFHLQRRDWEAAKIFGVVLVAISYLSVALCRHPRQQTQDITAEKLFHVFKTSLCITVFFFFFKEELKSSMHNYFLKKELQSLFFVFTGSILVLCFHNFNNVWFLKKTSTSITPKSQVVDLVFFRHIWSIPLCSISIQDHETTCSATCTHDHNCRKF